MKEEPLIKTNTHLKNSKLYEKLLFINVSSSSTIELGTLNPAILKALKKEKMPKLIFHPLDEKE
jgi:hypothetical protein